MTGRMQQTVCLAIDILYLVEYNCSFYLDSMWYLLCLRLLRLLLCCLAGFIQRKIYLVWPFLYFVRYTCSFKLTLMWYF